MSLPKGLLFDLAKLASAAEGASYTVVEDG
jgi:hypothetical protein